MMYTEEQLHLVKQLTADDAEELWKTGNDNRFYCYRDALASLSKKNHTYTIPQLQFLFHKRFQWEPKH